MPRTVPPVLAIPVQRYALVDVRTDGSRNVLLGGLLLAVATGMKEFLDDRQSGDALVIEADQGSRDTDAL